MRKKRAGDFLAWAAAGYFSGQHFRALGYSESKVMASILLLCVGMTLVGIVIDAILGAAT